MKARMMRSSALSLRMLGVVALLATLAGCASAPTRSSSTAAPSGASSTSSGPKRIVIAIAGELPVLNNHVVRSVYAYTSPGGSEVEDLITDGLADLDDDYLPQPKLAEAVPSLENGLWKLLDDGRMETTWKIRENAVWHDGTPFTTDDLLFTMTVARDREVPLFRDPAFAFIENIEASDERTITVTWTKPFIQADTLFTKDVAQPLPKHILEAPYMEDKANFAQLPFWNSEFIGTGPYRLKSFEAGSGLVLSAFDRYVLGRPKIDEIEVRFIIDTTTLVANLFSGSVDAEMGRGISVDQAIQAKEQWPAGQAIMAPSAWLVIFPQFLNPSPAVVGDTRFRKALMYALDRQQIVDTLQGGLSPVAHAFLSQNAPDYKSIEPDIVRYDYDPRQAAQLIEQIGYTRASDGFYQDAAGQHITTEIWASGESKQMIAVADSWKQVGVDANPVVLPPQRWNDREYVANFPAFRMNRQPNRIDSLRNFQSSAAPVPETNYVGQNYSRYMNTDLDALIDRYFTTIPKTERTQVLGQVVHQMTDQLNVMGIYHDLTPVLAKNQITGMTSPETGWNAQTWDLR